MDMREVSGYESLCRMLKALKFFEEKSGLFRVILFDFDGVIFTLGGRSAENIDERFSNIAVRLKNNGVIIGGFTRRRGQLIKPAARSIFAKNSFKNLYALKKSGITFDLLKNKKFEIGDDSMMSEGVFFAGKKRHSSKGKALEMVLDQILAEYGKLPDQLVLIDDSQVNLRSVSRVCKKNNIDFIGIHYLSSPMTVFTANVGAIKTVIEWCARKTIRIIGAREPEILDKILNN